jgi:acetylornithine deacetylase/succinyl-diaminopimelate desuccinylase-like protein
MLVKSIRGESTSPLKERTCARLLAYTRTHRSQFLDELVRFVRFPSVSSQLQHRDDLRNCAAWLAGHLCQIGLEHVQVISTSRHPIVYADWLHAPGRSVILVYGHYDVQPVDPLSEWSSPPFDPQVRNGNLYGRGASDDKGQLFTHLKAIESYLHTVGRLPINVKCLFEGEEEIGSTNLAPFIKSHRNTLRANTAVISDTRILAPDQPAITHALRGSLSLELEVSGPRQDLHSGNFGGAILNPIQLLSEILASLHKKNGRIAIPGFYENVKEWGRQERTYMKSVGATDTQILQDAGVSQGWGEPGFSLYERTTIRPALTINGITSGYQGPGGKGIIPARASAKVSFRLAPNQDPDQIERLFRQYVISLAPVGIQVKVKRYFGSKPIVISRRHFAMQAAALAYKYGFGSKPVFLRSGGTIPVVNIFQNVLNLPTVLMGFALPNDRMHAPNEKFHLENFYRGINTCIWFYTIMGCKKSTQEKRVDPGMENTLP